MLLVSKSVLVTGATGFLGSHLIERLSSDGVSVKALARREGRDRYIRDLENVEIIMGDITDAERMREVMQGCSIVFHVAAALGGDLQHQQHINVDGTRNIMQAAVNAGVDRVVHVSTVSVYGYRNRRDVAESTPYDPGADPYHITKVGAEKAVQEVAQANQVEYSIIRPGMIYGPRSNMWTKTMFKVAQHGIGIGDGSGSAYPIHVDDVVDLCITLATHPNATGQAFNCTPDPSPTWREFLTEYQKLTGRQRWIGIPVPLLRVLTWPAGFLAPKHSQARDLPDLIPFLSNYITYKMNKARDLLGWSPKVTLEAGVASCVPYLREKGLLKEKHT